MRCKIVKTFKVLLFLQFIKYSRECGEDVTLSQSLLSFEITPENYPEPYAADASCEWNFSSDETVEMSVECSDWHLYRSRRCRYSIFKLNGRKMCGRRFRKRKFTTDSLSVTFVATRNRRNRYRGFNCTVSIPEDDTDGGGGGGGGGGGCGDCTCGLKNPTRIVGGQATQANEYPWQAMLTSASGFQFCGGSLIAKRWVATAAHCLGGSTSNIRVVLGEHDKSSSDAISQTFSVSRKIIHNGYNSGTLNNDIGLLQLSSEATYNDYISAVCLPFGLSNLNSGSTLTVTGWGTTSSGGDDSDVLMEVDVNYITTSQCRTNTYGYGSDITNNMICAADSGKDSCQGDSGGPMVYENPTNKHNFLLGIVSWGNGCAVSFYPGVYTKVVNYIDWIKEETQAAEEFCEVAST